MARHDSQTVERATHALKGAMQSISAVPARARGRRLWRQIGRTGNVAEAVDSLACLKHEFERLVRL